MRFVAIDVETANADMSSICQIGLACYCDGTAAKEWQSYIDPQTFFDPINVSIHGIDKSTVAGAPTLHDVAGRLRDDLNGEIVVCHTHFDRVALHQAFQRCGLEQLTCRWLDSARVCRRAWEEFARRGYGLADVCHSLGYEFRQHDALEDAKAAAHIILRASGRTGLTLEQWLKRVKQPIDPSKEGRTVTRDPSADGPLSGEVVVFTGALKIPRREAADIAAGLGCRVEAGVTQRTTLLVVGDQDVRKLAGHDKSAKHRKAEALICDGQSIRIVRETDFRALAGLQ